MWLLSEEASYCTGAILDIKGKNMGPDHEMNCHTGEKSSDDNGYFEEMTRAVFQSGFNWKVIESKWDHFRQAFANFSIEVEPFGSAQDKLPSKRGRFEPDNLNLTDYRPSSMMNIIIIINSALRLQAMVRIQLLFTNF